MVSAVGGREGEWRGGGKGVAVRVGEVVHEDGGAFRHGCDGVFLDLRVGWEDAFGEALDHCSGKRKVLRVGGGGVSGRWVGRWSEWRGVRRWGVRELGRSGRSGECGLTSMLMPSFSLSFSLSFSFSFEAVPSSAVAGTIETLLSLVFRGSFGMVRERQRVEW